MFVINIFKRMKSDNKKELGIRFDKLLDKTKKLKTKKTIEKNLNQLIIIINEIVDDEIIKVKQLNHK